MPRIKARAAAGLIALGTTHDDRRVGEVERRPVIDADEVDDRAVEADAVDEVADRPAQDDAERHLGDMYFDLGRMADAEKIYVDVLKNAKTPDTNDRVTRRLIEGSYRLPVLQDNFKHRKLFHSLFIDSKRA